MGVFYAGFAEIKVGWFDGVSDGINDGVIDGDEGEIRGGGCDWLGRRLEVNARKNYFYFFWE